MKRLILLVLMSLILGCKAQEPPKESPIPVASPQKAKTYPWKLPSHPPTAPEIQYGESLIRQTAALLGPEAKNPQLRFTGNHLNCQSCHLEAGKKANALGFVGITQRYPNFRARENRTGNLAERINGCMERSMNGRSLPEESKEMQAMIAYMQWLSQDIPAGVKVEGQGLPDIPLLERAADPKQGQIVYAQKCALCHQAQGQGLALNPQDRSTGYAFPPLWGQDSFNNGAGMHRLITAAKYIKANMPLGNPTLTAEEAFDVAAYINSQPRPEKSGLDKDYPDRNLKPVDAPFPPHADNFSLEQHKYGPFQPILEVQKKSKN